MPAYGAARVPSGSSTRSATRRNSGWVRGVPIGPPYFLRRRSNSSSTMIRASPDIERDALGERQLGAVVYRVGGAAHVGLPGIGAGLAAAAGLLLAAERAADLGTG